DLQVALPISALLSSTIAYEVSGAQLSVVVPAGGYWFYVVGGEAHGVWVFELLVDRLVAEPANGIRLCHQPFSASPVFGIVGAVDALSHRSPTFRFVVQLRLMCLECCYASLA